MKQILITKQDGTQELFNSTKLKKSLSRAGASSSECKEVIEKIEKSLKEGMNTSEIYKHAFALLKSIKKPIASHYSMKRAILAFGPSGYPFEKFIAEIFKAKKYKNIKIGTIIRGTCVEHEVDVIAEKDNKKIAVEVKFHNKLGIRSDLKVALYIHARFEDLKKNSIQNKRKDIDEGWLITNTKFTKNAIKYAQCAGLKIISWDYPKEGNLHDLIRETHVQPVTALTTISSKEKNKLLEHQVLLCKDTSNKKDVLKSIGINDKKIQNIIAESQDLCQS